MSPKHVITLTCHHADNNMSHCYPTMSFYQVSLQPYYIILTCHPNMLSCHPNMSSCHPNMLSCHPNMSPCHLTSVCFRTCCDHPTPPRLTLLVRAPTLDAPVLGFSSSLSSVRNSRFGYGIFFPSNTLQ